MAMTDVQKPWIFIISMSLPKNFGIAAKGYTYAWKRVRKELDKCVLLCANCHREFHAGILQLPSAKMVEKQG